MNENCMYRPHNYPGAIAKDAKLYVKFCEDRILLKSFLDKFNIKYEISDLEETPFGLGIRIKKDTKKEC